MDNSGFYVAFKWGRMKICIVSNDALLVAHFLVGATYDALSDSIYDAGAIKRVFYICFWLFNFKNPALSKKVKLYI